MKISIIMPTYNDANTIIESLNSVINQTYKNYELIIIDDGSTDNVKEIISDFINENNVSDKIKYYYQENKDQLNAIKNGLKYVTGDYIYILHSDDLFYDNNSLKEFVIFQEKNPNYDAYIGDCVIIDKNSSVTGMQHTLKYKHKKGRVALVYLWLGRNLYNDMAFFKKECFEDHVYKHYLTDNTLFWISQSEKEKCLKVKNLNRPMYRYRVFEGNYINNEIGKLNVINGELRTLTYLMKHFYIPFYKIQYNIFRVFNKLKLTNIYSPIYFNKEEKNKGQIIKFVIKKRFNDGYKSVKFLNSIVQFFNNNENNREITLPKFSTEDIFDGADIRKFNSMAIKDNLPDIYDYVIDEMKIGFSTVVCGENPINNVERLLTFLCIKEYVTIKKN